MFNVLWGKNLNQSSISNAQVKCAVGEEGRLSFRNAVAVLAIVFCLHSNNSAAVTDDNIPFKIPQQRADTALTLFAEQANLTLVFPFDQVKDITANRLVGNYPIDTAINILLQDTGLMPTFSNQLVLNIAIDDKGKSMNKNTRKTLLASMVGLFAAGGLSTAAAQETESARAQGVLDEIIVTSTRRAESLNDAALSVAAIGGDEIDKRNLSEMNDYLRTIPGVSFVDQGVGRNAVVIRGLTIDPEQEAEQNGPTVGVYFGEVSIGGLSSLGGSADLRMVDLERVEVLRGPQGTLFGSGSLGGAVRNMPMAPDLSEFGGNINTSYSNTAEFGGDNTKLEAVLNIPLIEDELAIRVVAYDHQNEGYIKNIAGTQLENNGPVSPFYDVADAVADFGGEELYQNKNRVGDADYTGGRISALWTATDELSVTLQYITQDVEQEGFPYAQLVTGGYTQAVMQTGENVPALLGKGQGLKDDIEISNLVLEYDIGWATITSSSAWLKNDSEFNYDTASFFGGSPSIQFMSQTQDVFTEELRLVSQSTGPMQYILGLYYEDIEADREAYTYATADLDTFLLGTPFGDENPLVAVALIDKEVKQFSVYGEVSYEFTEQVTLSAGARRFDYERSDLTVQTGVFGNTTNAGESDETGTNLKLNLSYQIDEDKLLYAQWSEGFRLGNTNRQLPKSICDVNDDGLLDGTTAALSSSFDSDTTENFEIGAKLSLLDNRLQVNASIYNIDWNGIPIRVFPGKLPEQEEQICFDGVVVNVAEASSQGFELETRYQVSSDFTVNFSGAYTSVELAKDTPVLGAINGDRLPGTPEYNLNLSFEYDFEISGNPSYLRSSYSYVSDFYKQVGEKGDRGGDYGQVNLSLGVALGQFNVDLFADNLTNEDALTSIGALFPDSRAWRLRPRTIGLNVGYQF